MALLQGIYAVYAFIDPAGFAVIRGTDLVSISDSDWVRIYASRTLFVAFIVAALLYLKNYRILAVVALIGVVMPITDGWLAFTAGAASGVVIKHTLTIAYLLVTAAVLFSATKHEDTREV